MLWLRVFLTGVAVATLATPLLYLACIAVSLPLTSDGHRVMPIAHVGAALLLGTTLAVGASVWVARRGRAAHRSGHRGR